jgi:hypothetical protein
MCFRGYINVVKTGEINEKAMDLPSVLVFQINSRVQIVETEHQCAENAISRSQVPSGTNSVC